MPLLNKITKHVILSVFIALGFLAGYVYCQSSINDIEKVIAKNNQSIEETQKELDNLDIQVERYTSLESIEGKINAYGLNLRPPKQSQLYIISSKPSPREIAISIPSP